MTDLTRPFSPHLVTVFGGSGFLGRLVVQALARRNYRVRVAVRRPDLAGHLQTYAAVGQVHSIQANLRYPDSVMRAVAGAGVVVNVVGVLQETGRQTFDAVQAEGAGVVARAAAAEGARIVHVSALGADENSPSAYARSKARGEAAVLAERDAVVFRPSLLFGPGDSFFNRFATIARMLPVLPIAGAQTRFQPVAASDVAEAISRAVQGAVQGGRIYECGGPEIRTLRELIEYVARTIGRRRLVVDLPPRFARAQAAVMETLDLLSLGLLPNELKLTRDQVALLERDNVVSDPAIAEGRTLEGLGIVPTAFSGVVPAYLARFRKTGQFDIRADAESVSETPDTLAPDSRRSLIQPRPGGAPVGQKAPG